jgi:hypothetical protein
MRKILMILAVFASVPGVAQSEPADGLSLTPGHAESAPANLQPIEAPIYMVGGGLPGMCKQGDWKCTCCQNCTWNLQICYDGCDVRFPIGSDNGTCTENCNNSADLCEGSCSTGWGGGGASTCDAWGI